MSIEQCSKPTPVELVYFDVALKGGVLSARVSVVEAIKVMEWLFTMGWVSQAELEDLLFGLGVRHA